VSFEPEVSPPAFTVSSMHWTSFRRERGIQYSVLLEDDTEVNLVQAEGKWKLCYSTSTDGDCAVVDLGTSTTKVSCLLLLMTGWPNC
jgi:hypothetical protein